MKTFKIDHSQAAGHIIRFRELIIPIFCALLLSIPSCSTKTESSSGKETDSSEGVPGYLVGPDQIAVAESEATNSKNEKIRKVSLSAPKGSTKTKSGDLTDQKVRAVQVPKDKLPKKGQPTDETFLFEGTEVASVAPNADGSFKLDLELPEGSNDPVFIQIVPKDTKLLANTIEVKNRDDKEIDVAFLNIADKNFKFKAVSYTEVINGLLQQLSEALADLDKCLETAADQALANPEDPETICQSEIAKLEQLEVGIDETSDLGDINNDLDTGIDDDFDPGL